jgi:hypothetical protein
MVRGETANPSFRSSSFAMLETTLALRDAYPRFGMVEVGYTAD